MRLLALDTSSIACSVALQDGEQVFEQHEELAREHTRLLVPMIQAVLKQSGIDLQHLEGIVLGNGPGSFIGMRIAASVAQGLAHGAGLNIVPVSSLVAVAAQVFAEYDATEVVVTQDAHMHEVYLGSFTPADDGTPTAAFAERLHGQDTIAELDRRAGDRRVAAGAGWSRYPALLENNHAHLDAVADVLYPRARFLLQSGARALASGAALRPADLSPAYLRQKVAEKPAPTS
jgi:tRNA threonylcarbamoyladenosine biosynthesis protein TsaB